jgi:hypothetical protein
MKRDDSSLSIGESVSREIIENFIQNVKNLDAKVVHNRLHAIVNFYGDDEGFLETAARFSAVADPNLKTSADE